MAFFHRKLLCKPDIHDKENSCKPPPRLTLDPQSPSRPTVDPPPPPPPPPPQSFDHQSFSPFLIIMFGGLAVSICFICYLTTCATRYRRRQINLANTDHETYEDFVNEDLGPVVPHPIWLINTIGLDQSQIESIHVFKYKRDEKLIEGTDCSVCLSEFEDDESLRLLPKCSHAFHVPCIDTWLRSHKNCPLCRAPIFIKNTNDDRTDVHATTEPNLIESSTTEQTEPPVNDFETNDDQDHHVVEVENNDEIVKTDLEEELIAMRRSVSNSQLVISKKPSIITKGDHEHRFKGSSSNIHLSSKVTKSSSIRRSLRKASSYTSKSRPYTRSY